MRFTPAAALAALVGTAAAAQDSRTFAVLRFNNVQLTKGRMDPIISPGKPSSHVHNVMGGSNFGLGSTGEDLMNSKCSNAMVKGDNSNYWYPALYFKDPNNGTLESVDIFYVNAYYFFEPTNDDIKAFPVGLQIVTGNATTRLPPAFGSGINLDPSQGPTQPIQWTCPRSGYDPPSYPANSNGMEAGMQDPVNQGAGVGFPDMNCDGYASPLRADMHFPSCYNPKAGLTNYEENMAFPVTGSDGKQDCPKGWTHTPHLFIEVYWNTPVFADRWTQGQGTQPFVLADGDATGYSSHGDFMAAWDEDLLQHIIDTCNTGTGGMDTCAGLTYGLNEGDCTIPSAVDEKVDGFLDKLPGDNPITGFQYGEGSGGSSGGSGGGSGESSSVYAKPTKPAHTKPAASKPAATKPVKDSSTKAGTQPSSISEAAPTAPSSSDYGLPVPTEPATGVAGNPVKPSSACSVKVHTVVHTVTVTAGAPAGPTDTASNSTGPVGGFQYAGCFKDSSARALSGDTMPDLGPMTNEKCVSHCKSSGFSLAGTEYGGQCYCGNDLVGSEKLDDSECSAQCEGDSSDLCGGSWALSVYSKDGEASLKSAKVRRRHFLNHNNRYHSGRLGL